ncbi:MAG: FecR family protein, partial [Cyclobacteriaceae bacterium]
MESQEILSKYFSGNATAEEIEQVENWMEASDENMNEFLQFKSAWQMSNADRFDSEKAFANIAPKLKKKTATVVEMTPDEKPNYMKIAAAIAILIVSSILVYGYFAGDIFDGDIVASGTITDSGRQIKLTDGSKLFLAESGSLTYASDFKADNQRKVRLEGQAFFDIRKDKDKPFIIMTNNAEIEVTGTSFLVKEK